ncbi:MAG TPA: hypothetical protein VFE50_19110 [Cyclobacteriaceae bacterium]|nr:hypothetical protein [Cyclobacteriaceae bacterium]
MKKRTFLLSVLALALLVSSCTTYQCPTYSKKTEAVKKQERI